MLAYFFVFFIKKNFLSPDRPPLFSCRLQSLEELLDDMHVACDIDPLDDPMWDQVMLVHPKVNI